MQNELYFDISSTATGGSLTRQKNGDGSYSFLYVHSIYDAYSDELKIYKTPYPSFEAFWQVLTKNSAWFYLHLLYVRPRLYRRAAHRCQLGSPEQC